MSTTPKFWEPSGVFLDRYRTLVEDVAKALWEQRLSLLIGAGLSCCEPSNLPSGLELAKRMLRWGKKSRDPNVFMAPIPELDSIAERERFEAVLRMTMETATRKVDFLDFLKSQLGYSSPILNAGHHALLRIASSAPGIFPSILYTTNFDLLLETAFGGARRGPASVVTVVRSRFERLRTAEVNRQWAIVHLHGALADEVQDCDDMWPLESAYVLEDDPLMPDLIHELYQSVFVFLGYSLSDIDLRIAYFPVVKFLKRRGSAKSTVTVQPVKSETECDTLTDLCKGRDMKLAPVTASRFLVDLADIVCKPSMTAHKHAVLAALSDETAESLHTKVNQMKDLIPALDEERLWDYLHTQLKRSSERLL